MGTNTHIIVAGTDVNTFSCEMKHIYEMHDIIIDLGCYCRTVYLGHLSDTCCELHLHEAETERLQEYLKKNEYLSDKVVTVIDYENEIGSYCVMNKEIFQLPFQSPPALCR